MQREMAEDLEAIDEEDGEDYENST